jgi:hypothetical protein
MDSLPDFESEIMNLKSYQALKMMPLEKKIALVNFLDTAQVESVKRIRGKITKLEAEGDSGIKQGNKSLARIQGTSPGDTMVVIALNSGIPGEDMIETDYGLPGGNVNDGSVDFIYKWEAFENILGLYRIYSNESFQIEKDATTFYKINSLEHVSSYIVGITFGVTWTETLCLDYAGLYNASLILEGTLSGFGISRPLSNQRYVNAGIVWGTQGGHY